MPVSKIKATEMTKLLKKIHLSVKIGLINEMNVVAGKARVNIFEMCTAGTGSCGSLLERAACY